MEHREFEARHASQFRGAQRDRELDPRSRKTLEYIGVCQARSLKIGNFATIKARLRLSDKEIIETLNGLKKKDLITFARGSQEATRDCFCWLTEKGMLLVTLILKERLDEVLDVLGPVSVLIDIRRASEKSSGDALRDMKTMCNIVDMLEDRLARSCYRPAAFSDRPKAARVLSPNNFVIE